MSAVTDVYAPDWPRKTGGRAAREVAAREILALARRADALSVEAYNEALPSLIDRAGGARSRMPSRGLDMGDHRRELADACGRAVARAEAAGASPGALGAVEGFCEALMTGAFEGPFEMLGEAERAAQAVRDGEAEAEVHKQ